MLGLALKSVLVGWGASLPLVLIIYAALVVKRATYGA